MLVAFDFGISNTDIAFLKDNKTTFHTIPSQHKTISPELIKEILAIYALSISEVNLIGVTGGSANLFLTQSYKLSEVSLVSPLKYLALIFAIIFGYIIWDEIPTSKTLIGALLVIFSSFIIFKREMVLKKSVSVARHE